MISKTIPIFSEPKCLVTGVEGAGKTLFAVQQADLLTKAEGGELYQINIRGADPAHLPKLPFDVSEMAFDEAGQPVVDKETGDHLPKWATLPPGSVIVIDEAHKVYPQRGPGRPPKHVEMLAEGRQFGVRFVLLSQSPDSIDAFLRERISRHFHLERKGNLSRATVFEFDHCVTRPRTAWQERKDAPAHLWAYPTEYYGWYTSAKSHHFKMRIPWKVWAALVAIPLIIYAGFRVVSQVGALANGGVLDAQASTMADESGRGGHARRERAEPLVITDAGQYLAQFAPVVDELPYSAPVFQNREVVAQPDLYCVAAGAGEDALGQWREASCKCFTEQGTPYSPNRDAAVARQRCEHIARHGFYNPYRGASGRGRESSNEQGAKPEKPRPAASGVRPALTSIAAPVPAGVPASVPAGDPGRI